jgi:putative DNA primase/helicase
MKKTTTISLTSEVIAIMAQNDIFMGSDEEIIPDGDLRRFQLSDEHRSKKSGWYVVIDNSFVSFGSWKGDKFTVKLKHNTNSIKWDKSDIAKRIKEADQKRELDHQHAATNAWEIWNSSTECHSHVYLSEKKVIAHGLRANNGNLLIPLTNKYGQLSSLQFINSYGKKWFLKNGKIKGNHFNLGNILNASKVIISEGYSTAASLFDVTNLPQVIAFNANNLVDTARVIRTKYPNIEIIIAADNDFMGKQNTGLIKGKEAARTVSGELIFPKFLPNDLGSDFNDFVKLYGKDKLSSSLIHRGFYD